MTSPSERPVSLTDYCFYYKQRGGRDLWWCFLLNEPGIITYPDGKPTCPGCNCVADSTGPNPGDYTFYGNHCFITSILKPIQSKVYCGEKGTHE